MPSQAQMKLGCNKKKMPSGYGCTSELKKNNKKPIIWSEKMWIKRLVSPHISCPPAKECHTFCHNSKHWSCDPIKT